jgi:hypothetical protein
MGILVSTIPPAQNGDKESIMGHKPKDFICYLPKWRFYYVPTEERWGSRSVMHALDVNQHKLGELVRSGAIASALPYCIFANG